MISNVYSNYKSIVKTFKFKKKKKRKKVVNTEEKNRGETFLTKFKLLRLLLDNKDKVYNKELLAKLYFQTNFANNSQKKYVGRIMNIFHKINLVYFCDEKGKKLKINPKTSRHYWKLNKSSIKDLGL